MPYDPRGVFWPEGQPSLAYELSPVVRFVRSQRCWSGEAEQEAQYRGPSEDIAGWAAARASPNLIPWTPGAEHHYSRPSGPTSPRDLLRQATVPPDFPAGDFREYLPPEARFAPGLVDLYRQGDGAFAPAPPGACPCVTVEDQAAAVALGLKKILPELATAIATQGARAQAQFLHPRPANVDIPIRAYEFNEGNLAPAASGDGVFVAVQTHVVPVGQNCVLRQLELQAESAAALADTILRLTIDGSPVRGYESLTRPDFGDVNRIIETNVKAIEGQTIAVEAQGRTALVTHQIRAIMRGWDFFPSLMANLDSIEGWRGR